LTARQSCVTLISGGSSYHLESGEFKMTMEQIIGFVIIGQLTISTIIYSMGYRDGKSVGYHAGRSTGMAIGRQQERQR